MCHLRYVKNISNFFFTFYQEEFKNKTLSIIKMHNIHFVYTTKKEKKCIWQCNTINCLMFTNFCFYLIIQLVVHIY